MNGDNDYDEQPLELTRETTVERIGPDLTESGQVKTVVKREYEVGGRLVNETLVQYGKLFCGHTSQPGGVCACGRSSCRACVEACGSNCSVCGKLVMNCCATRSYFNKSVVYCPKCRTFGWFVRLWRG